MIRGALATTLGSAAGVQLAFAVQVGASSTFVATILAAGAGMAAAALLAARRRLGRMPLVVCALVATWAFLLAFAIPHPAPGNPLTSRHGGGGHHHVGA